MSIENRSHAGLTPTSAELKGNKVSSLSSSETKLSICNLVKNESVSALREDAPAPATTPTALRALTTIMDSRNLNHELSAVDHALAQPAQEYTRNRLAEIKKRRKVVNQVQTIGKHFTIKQTFTRTPRQLYTATLVGWKRFRLRPHAENRKGYIK